MKSISALPLLVAALVFAGCGKAPEKPAAAPVPAASAPTPTPAAAAGPRLITIETDDAQFMMKFSVKTIEATAGEELRVLFVNKSALPKAAMGHNLIFLKKGTDMDEFIPAAALHKETTGVPPEMADKVIAFTKILGPGEREEITFKAPAEAGDYDYICSFPGHYLSGMRGLLKVKAK
jgi:azurin